MKIFLSILFVILFFPVAHDNIFAQHTGEPLPGYNPDTVFVFESPRPLVSLAPSERKYNNYAGFSLIMSGSGYGMGMYYSKSITEDLHAFTGFFLSGARNTDEIEYWNTNTGETFIPGKINRLYLLPLMFGAEYFLFNNQIDDSFKPYVRLGLGPSFIFANSYNVEFFKALGQTDTYIRFGAIGGIGAFLMSQGKTNMGIDISYYYIPFGGNGIESIVNFPIRDFGGIVLSLNFGFKF